MDHILLTGHCLSNFMYRFTATCWSRQFHYRVIHQDIPTATYHKLIEKQQSTDDTYMSWVFWPLLDLIPIYIFQPACTSSDIPPSLSDTPYRHACALLTPAVPFLLLCYHSWAGNFGARKPVAPHKPEKVARHRGLSWVLHTGPSIASIYNFYWNSIIDLSSNTSYFRV